MSTAKVTKGERLGDPEGDLDYIPKPELGRLATAAAEKKRIKRDRQVESFRDGSFGFVPDSRRAITIALSDVNDQIEAIYTGVRHGKPTSAVGEFYENHILARAKRSAMEVSYLSDANSPIDYTDGRTFSVGALKSSSQAMKTVALFKVRQKALYEADWTILNSDRIETTTQLALHDMGTLSDLELSDSWHAAWESANNELTFWSSMERDALKNPRVRSHLGIEDE